MDIAMEGFETTVYLYPAAGAGIQLVGTPQGQIPVPIPFCEYKRVGCVEVDDTLDMIRFTKPTGERIFSNIPYVIVQTPAPASEA